MTRLPAGQDGIGPPYVLCAESLALSGSTGEQPRDSLSQLPPHEVAGPIKSSPLYHIT